MAEKLNNIEKKLDKVLDILETHQNILEKNTESLIIHERRTDLAEQQIELLAISLEKFKDREAFQMEALKNEITPIKVHVQTMDKLIVIIFKYVIPSVAAVAVALYKMNILKF